MALVRRTALWHPFRRDTVTALASPGMETESAAAKGLGLEAFQWAPPSSNHVKQGGPICSIDDVIVYCRNELWVIKKHMVKCRVESAVCIYFG